MRKAILAMLFVVATCLGAVAQKVLVTGKVTDSSGVPLSGASIKVKGSKGGVSANNDGIFKIEAAPGSFLLISATGFLEQQVSSESVTTVALLPDVKTLSEVVVTALGVQRQAKSLGYSTARVSAAELNQGKATNIASGLSAKVAGLQINLVNNGVKPDVRVTLRGTRSFLGNNQALLVVDGNILPIRFINSLSPNDVENVTVLKGASASVLYGTDASNGVIIVTTKKGKTVPKITLSSTISMESVAYMPKLQDRFGQNGGEYNTTNYPSSIYFPGDPFHPYSPYENQQYGPEFNGQTVPVGQAVRIFRPDGTFFDSTRITTYSNKKNSKKDFFDRGITSQLNASYSVGDQNSSFYMSFEDVNTKGIVPKDENRRDIFRINGSKNSGRFGVDYALSYAATKTNTTPSTFVPFRWGTSDYLGNYAAGSSDSRSTGGSYYQGRPLYWTIINAPANIDLKQFRDWRTDPFASPDGYFNAYYGNPWWQIDQTRLVERNNDFLGTTALKYKVADWFNITYRFSFARNEYSNNYTKAGYNFAPWAVDLGQTGEGGNIAASLGGALQPSSGTGTSSNQRITSDLTT